VIIWFTFALQDWKDGSGVSIFFRMSFLGFMYFCCCNELDQTCRLVALTTKVYSSTSVPQYKRWHSQKFILRDRVSCSSLLLEAWFLGLSGVFLQPYWVMGCFMCYLYLSICLQWSQRRRKIKKMVELLRSYYWWLSIVTRPRMRYIGPKCAYIPSGWIAICSHFRSFSSELFLTLKKGAIWTIFLLPGS
jgi:hypothetical protein